MNTEKKRSIEDDKSKIKKQPKDKADLEDKKKNKLGPLDFYLAKVIEEDKDGSKKKDLLVELKKSGEDAKKIIEKGLGDKEFRKYQNIILAIEDAKDVITKAWHKVHGEQKKSN